METKLLVLGGVSRVERVDEFALLNFPRHHGKGSEAFYWKRVE